MATKRPVARPTKKLPRKTPTPRGGTLPPTAGPISTPPSSTTVFEITHSAERYAYPRSLIRDVPDFPRPGIMFKDITPLLADPRAFHMVLDGLAEHFIAEHIDVIAGIEARGFIFGGALAARLNASFVPVRKPGKLPADTDSISYDLEYGSGELEIHVDSIESGAKVVVVDDLLATGGTASAAAELVRRQGGYVFALAFFVELTFLEGREKLGNTPVVSLIKY